MRYAVLSDIHSNLEALTAVLDALAPERIDRYLCLGDMIGYGADPSACLSRLQAADAVMVAGNHEWACIGKLELNWFNSTARAAAIWTRDQLGFTDLDTLRRLPLTTVDGPFTLVHATLRHPERFEYLVDLAQAVDIVATCRTLFCLYGHTHESCVIEYHRRDHRMPRVLSGPEELREVAYTPDEESMRYIVNPGSVGQPRDGDPRASAAIIDTERRQIAVRRVAYDITSAQRKIREAGLPEFLADRLAVGR